MSLIDVVDYFWVRDYKVVYIVIKWVLDLVKWYCYCFYVLYVFIGDELVLIVDYDGLIISEVCLYYLFFNIDDYVCFGLWIKVNLLIKYVEDN